jgi:hypothetical protein
MKLATRATGLVGLLLGLVACDPVQSDAIAALGGEPQGVHPGPLHRPGQPCLLCHDGALGDPEEFSVAGTVFQNSTDNQAARGARVELTAADGSSSTQTTNAAGNFYIPARNWQPKYPLQVSVSFQSLKVSMTSNIGRDGACASCHFDPAGADSPGHVYAIPIDAGMP